MRRVALALCTLFLLACDAGPPRPVEPVWGKQSCAHCTMLVSERQPAAQALLRDGSRKFFDDVGCLAAYLTQPGVVAQAAWVHGPDSDLWVDALTAHYSAGHRTPMDFGYLAASSGITFAELKQQVAAKTKRERGSEAP
jgi:copper chaperone NosL